ncbi:MAG: hypothetical protein O7F73_18340 [Gammaproteobacteria bacterium]|nr:hypothetical protein [Gammaproteobacteria bacterium]
MFFKKSEQQANVSVERALRHLLVFQIKLAADALRDLFLSPISIVVFIIDAVRKPSTQESLYLRLMVAGRRSDRIINLFDEYSEDDHYTIDETIAQLEDALQKSRE